MDSQRTFSTLRWRYRNYLPQDRSVILGYSIAISGFFLKPKVGYFQSLVYWIKMQPKFCNNLELNLNNYSSDSNFQGPNWYQFSSIFLQFMKQVLTLTIFFHHFFVFFQISRCICVYAKLGKMKWQFWWDMKNVVKSEMSAGHFKLIHLLKLSKNIHVWKKKRQLFLWLKEDAISPNSSSEAWRNDGCYTAANSCFVCVCAERW